LCAATKFTHIIIKPKTPDGMKHLSIGHSTLLFQVPPLVLQVYLHSSNHQTSSNNSYGLTCAQTKHKHTMTLSSETKCTVQAAVKRIQPWPPAALHPLRLV
jgi:hypothetical protein